MKVAADEIKGVSLELGGKSAILVFEDADIELALSLVMGGIFFNGRRPVRGKYADGAASQPRAI